MQMDQKITDTLVEIGDILSHVYKPSELKLYSLTQLGIVIPYVHHKKRNNTFDTDDKATLIKLINKVQVYMLHYEITDHHQRYYLYLFINKFPLILNE
jgi:hypothetical protein